eukprot:TRINITY_DN1824_c0_g1_i1.p1 TRINITY_DN1824_c0_g1~~TRINITY_DN1824_c0_g1_i1.p1  ORF type:complete len:203 (+),score=50.93 TRINITY_DN1824_c0_g1_i1:53-610(+)
MDDKKQAELGVIGVLVKVKTSFGDEIIGEFLSFDPISSCIVLRESCTNPTTNAPSQNFHVLKSNFVKEVQAIGPPAAPSDVSLKPVDLNKLRLQEDHALRVARSEASKIGIGVTPEAQEIFNALSKTLPCRWDRDVIVVFEDTRISTPYTVESCLGGEVATPSELSLVKKVLEGARNRMKTKSNS